MATVGKYYHLEFLNADHNNDRVKDPQTVHIRIYDLSIEDDTTTSWNVTELTPSGDPFHTSSVDNSDDKYTGIRPTQATIKFISSSLVNVSSFVDAEIPIGGVDVGDPRWYVEAYLNDYLDSNFVFKGFLNLDDCSEAFMPDKNEVVLVANDALGILKNIPLTDFNDDNPTGYNRIADYLVWALSKTGLELNLNAIFNIREQENGTGHFFDTIYLQAKTFEEQIGTCINCYDAIEKILGEIAFLCQRGGEWWIVRVDEMNNNGYYRAVYNSNGVLQSIDSSSTFFIKAIEKDFTAIFFSQEQTQVYLTRPYKFIKETYQFEYPLEIIDNIDFSRGVDPYTPLNMSPVVIDGVTYYVTKFHIQDWTLGATLGAVNNIAYIKKLYSDSNKTYEKQRYVVIEPGSPFRNYYLESNPIPIEKNDKMSFSVDFRYTDTINNNSVSGMPIARIILNGNDGSTWAWGRQGTSPNRWFSGTEASLQFTSSVPVNFKDWQTVSTEVGAAPVSGTISIRLLHVVADFTTKDIHFSNIQFSYTPYINGDYSKYSSYYFKVYRDENYINKREKQVYISDSFKPLFKGQLFKQDGSDYVLTNRFYAWNDVNTTSPDDQYIHPYGHIQAFDVWNQHRNKQRKFQATSQGLGYGSLDQSGLFLAYPSLVHQYLLQDASEHTNNRYFMLTSFDIDWFLCEWTGNLVEVYNSDTPRVYDDNLETKYIQ